MDQETPPQPIRVANMAVGDMICNTSTNQLNLQGYKTTCGGRTGSCWGAAGPCQKYTDSTGQLPETLTVCAPACRSSGTCVTAAKTVATQTWTVAGPASAQASPEACRLPVTLNSKVEGYRLSAPGLADGLASISARFRVPMGIEWVRNAMTLRKVNLSLSTDSVRDIISSVVGGYSGYACRVDGCVVDIFPTGLVASRGNFLNLRVPAYFQANNEVGGIVNQDLQLAVQDIVSPRKLPPGAGVGGSYTSGAVQEEPLTLALAGLTIRQALNELIERSERKMWIVTFSSGRGLTPTGFWRTETLWHPTPFPDTSQPMWDFLSWSQYRTSLQQAGSSLHTRRR